MRRSLFVLAILAVASALEYAINNHGSTSGLRHVLVAIVALAAVTALVGGRSRDLALMLTSLCVGVGLLEAGTLWLEKKPAVWIDGGLRQPRPYVGFGPSRPGRYPMKQVAADGHVVFDVTATIGNDLLRASTAPKGEGAVAFFGDSFTFGAGIEDKDTITQAFADLTRQAVPAPNLSFSAWSPANNLAILKHDLHADALRGARRFVLMTAAWHIDRTACKVDYVQSAPRYRLDAAGELAQHGTCFDGRLHDVLHGFALFRDIIEPRLARIDAQDADTYFAIVDQFVRVAKEKYGVPPTIIVLPDLPGYLAQLKTDEAAYIARLKTSGADILVDPLSRDAENNPYAIPGDGHPTGLANRTLAKMLIDHLAGVAPQAGR